MRDRVVNYFDTLSKLIVQAEVSDRTAKSISIGEGFEWVRAAAHRAHDSGNKIMFIGNGGSAGIASHLAVDFSKNGNMRSLAFSDPSFITCLGNDYGFEHIFAKQIEFHGRKGDLLIAISSSGKSANINNGVSQARECGCEVVTFSGFGDDNPLRKSGDINFYIRSPEYGFVEVAHLSLCHAILDLDMGWGNAKRQA